MSDSASSLSSKLWAVASTILGFAVAVWIAVKLIEQVWVTLLIVAGVIVAASAMIVAVKWWWQRRQW